jgi:hypothetical protein
MKKSFIFCIAIFSLFFIFSLISAEITGESITGKPTSESLALNITVALPTTILAIISPKNDTYLINKSLLLNYTQINADMIWYNIDGGINTTITGAIYFDISEGEHTLYLYGNNSYGQVSKNVTFTSNITFLTIFYSEYNGSTKGDSTDFKLYAYGDLQNMSKIILENSLYGKIQFNEIINITNDYIPNDSIVDLDSNTNISLNRIDLNYTALPNFNVSSTLELYNLPFTNPRILKDGTICPTSICTFEYFTNNTLKFNVTEFGIYSAEETPITEVVVTPGGGGGGTSPVKIKNFSTDKESIYVSLKQGDSTYEEITIKNKERSNLLFTLTIYDILNLTKLSETQFSLKPDEEKTITIDFFTHEDTNPNLYIGKLIIKTGATVKEIPIAIEVESSEALFDIKINIPNQFKRIISGEDVLARIQLYNLGEDKEVDVAMDYIIIKEKTGEVILFERDTLAVEGHLEFIKSIKIPESAGLGNYLFYARVNYEDKIASATDTFKVDKNFIVFFNRVKFVLLIFLIIILMTLFFILIKRRKKEKEEGKKYKTSKKYRLKKIIIHPGQN